MLIPNESLVAWIFNSNIPVINFQASAVVSALKNINEKLKKENVMILLKRANKFG